MEKAVTTLRRITSESDAGRTDSGLDTSTSTFQGEEDDSYDLAENIPGRFGSEVKNLNHMFHLASSNTSGDVYTCANESRGHAEGKECEIYLSNQESFHSDTRDESVQFDENNGPQDTSTTIESQPPTNIDDDSTYECQSRDSLTSHEIANIACRTRHSYSERILDEHTPMAFQPNMASLRYSLRLSNRGSFRRQQINSRRYNAKRLLHWKEEIDADLTHAHMLSTSLKDSISQDLEKISMDNVWVAESIKSRQDIVGSLAQCYDIEDNSDTLKFVSNFMPSKLPRRQVDYDALHAHAITPRDNNTPVQCDRLKQLKAVHPHMTRSPAKCSETSSSSNASESCSDKNSCVKFDIRDPNRIPTRKGSIRTPRKTHFTKYLVSDVTNAQKNYYV